MICGVPQDAIFGQLHFIIYIINLCYTFEFLKPVIFADNTNVFGKSANSILAANLGLGKLSE